MNVLYLLVAANLFAISDLASLESRDSVAKRRVHDIVSQSVDELSRQLKNIVVKRQENNETKNASISPSTSDGATMDVVGSVLPSGKDDNDPKALSTLTDSIFNEIMGSIEELINLILDKIGCSGNQGPSKPLPLLPGEVNNSESTTPQPNSTGAPCIGTTLMPPSGEPEATITMNNTQSAFSGSAQPSESGRLTAEYSHKVTVETTPAGSSESSGGEVNNNRLPSTNKQLTTEQSSEGIVGITSTTSLLSSDGEPENTQSAFSGSPQPEHQSNEPTEELEVTNGIAGSTNVGTGEYSKAAKPITSAFSGSPQPEHQSNQPTEVTSGIAGSTNVGTGEYSKAANPITSAPSSHESPTGETEEETDHPASPGTQPGYGELSTMPSISGAAGTKYQCGLPVIQPQSDERIVGGKEAVAHSYPWQVLIVAEKNGRKVPHCGGSLVSEHFVVTAAQCLLLKTKYYIRVGDHNLKYEDPMEKLYEADWTTSHENANGMVADLALVRTKEPIEFNDHVIPICLTSRKIQPGTPVVITGWGKLSESQGYSMELQELHIETLDFTVCQDEYDILNEGMICAGDLGGLRDACQGDSGGPMITKFGEKWALVGVISGGRSCGYENSPGIYTDVLHYWKWIFKHLTRRTTSNPPAPALH